jgi:pimeloyl-ACP methyl ester carboxylesterase
MNAVVTSGKPFGGLPVPESIELLNVHASVGVLTAMRSVVPDGARNATRGVALFIPGFTGSKEDFYPLFPHLARLGWQVWSYSQRGQADSAAPKGLDHYTVESAARDAIEVAKAVARETGRPRVDLVGHSYGGLVAQAAVILASLQSRESRESAVRQGVFRSLALMCSGPHGWPGRHADLLERFIDDPRDQWSYEHPTITSREIPSLSPEERFVRQRSMSTSRDELIGALHQLASVHDTSFELRDAHLPALIFHGQDDFAWPQEWQRREANIVNARYEIIPHAGHCPNVENPAATAALLDQFWGGLDG